jgi:hypothetical protein
MTEALRRRLAIAADKSGRSLNSEIVWRLSRSMDGDITTLTEDEIKSIREVIATMKPKVGKL